MKRSANRDNPVVLWDSNYDQKWLRFCIWSNTKVLRTPSHKQATLKANLWRKSCEE